MRQKKPDASALLESSSKLLPILAASPDEVKKYLEMTDFSAPIQEPDAKKLYNYIRDRLAASLSDKLLGGPVFAALIERIARLTIILDRMDKILIGMSFPMTSISKEGRTSDYLKLQTEHRNCVEAFANMRFAMDKTVKTKTLETIRQIISEE